MNRLAKIRGSSVLCLSLLISKLGKVTLGFLPQGPRVKILHASKSLRHSNERLWSQ